MKTSNFNAPGARAARVTRGGEAATRAGGNIRIKDQVGNDLVVSTLVLATGTIGDLDDDAALVTIGTTGVLAPDASLSVVKNIGNPTWNFAALPEGTIQLVSGTYYCPYINQTDATDIRMATATAIDGAWTAYGGTPNFALAGATWAPAAVIVYAPEIVEVGGTFYMFYSTAITAIASSSQNAIGLATCATVNGTYIDSGAAVLSPGAASSPTSRRVGEASVIFQGGQWVMAFMGEDSDFATGDSEQVFIATAPAPQGPWTVANSGNPVIPFGSAGSGYEALAADPFLFFENGYYWIMFAGSATSTPTLLASQFLAYATDPTGTWTVLPSPILSPGASGAWDDAHVFRGSLYKSGSQFYGVYCGFDGVSTYKGGSFLLNISGSGAIATTPVASAIAIDDVGGYYTGTDVEAALQEIGASLAASDPVADLLAGVDLHVHVVDEQFTADGSRTTFELANAAVDESVMAYDNGTRSPVTLGGTSNDTITFSVAPTAGHTISVDYAARLT